ncbi:phosphotransferase enzyme family protein [Solwaraspora sp. WMMB762]|uniref:phosphotransferase enzyme family protein n=1 Tax=Solwaraspora sp. WMMB762 TaxID=3404120 RepID=UPI003B9540B2
MTDPQETLLLACRQVGVDVTGAELIRSAENVIYRLPGGVVARVSRDGQLATAGKEVRVSRWLNESGIPAVRAIEELPQPVAVDGRAVTFWHELPPHREGSIGQLAQVLQQLHRLRPPASLELPPLAPFVRLEQRIAEATVFAADDRAWLLDHLHGLQASYRELPPGLPYGAVHGDAWAGNIVDTDAGPVVLDLERFAFGPPEWDLVSVAVDHLTFSAEYAPGWTKFCRHYGYDVTDWPECSVLRDARELRKVTFAAQLAQNNPALRDQAHYRLACIRGEHGNRPWGWEPVP